MMSKYNHFGYYFLMSTILIAGLVITWRLGPDKNLQMISFMVLSIIYAAVGIVHHFLDHDLVGKIVIEYILIAGLGMAASFFIFKGGFGI